MSGCYVGEAISIARKQWLAGVEGDHQIPEITDGRGKGCAVFTGNGGWPGSCMISISHKQRMAEMEDKG